MTTDIELSIENFPKQQAVFNAVDDHQYVIVPKGRRSGFTVGLANNFIEEALAGKFKQGLWGDVVNSNIEKYISRLFVPELSKLPSKMWHWSKDPHVVHIANAVIDFRSAQQPESWEGFGYDKAALNEAGIILKDLYLYEHAVKPMLWDSNCRIIIGGTPKGKGKFFELYERGLDPEQKAYTSIRMSPFDNPYINHQRIYEDMKDMSELAIKQEIYGEFLDDSGIVFRGISNVATLNPHDAEAQKPLGDHIYVIGCDLAKLEDFTVIVVYDRTTNNQMLQMRFNKLEWPYIRQRIKDVSRKYGNALVMLDSTGVGEPTYDDLVRMGVPIQPMKFNNTLKSDLINKLANWVELRHIKMLKLDETIQEFNNFSYDMSEKTNRVFYGAPVGFHDDIVIAHALAVWSLQPKYQTKPVTQMATIERDLYELTHKRAEEFEEYEDSQYEGIDV